MSSRDVSRSHLYVAIRIVRGRRGEPRQSVEPPFCTQEPWNTCVKSKRRFLIQRNVNKHGSRRFETDFSENGSVVTRIEGRGQGKRTNKRPGHLVKCV